MGIKENFTQAVRELTGGGKNQPDTNDKANQKQVEDLRRAVEAETIEPIAVLQPQTPVQPTAFPQSVTSTQIPPQTQSAPVTIVEQTAAQFRQSQATQKQEAPKASHAGLDISVQELAETMSVNSVQAPLYTAPVPPSNPAAGNAFGDFNANMGVQTSTGIPTNANVPMLNPVPDDGITDELTVISKNTVIEGNIRSFANMNVDGNVRGDIETTKNIELNGKIIGNLTCNNAHMLTSQIQGNIRMKGNIVMGRDTLLIGDLVSTYAKVNGKIKGNLEIGGKAELKGDSVIFGDISASTITVDDGAIIQGYVSTTFLNKEESRNIFPEAISIAE